MIRKEKIKNFFNILLNRYGPQSWWPAESEFECIIGAILTQNTSWANVVKALSLLKKNELLSLDKINGVSVDVLAQLIRPSGYYNQKALKIKRFVNYVKDYYSGNLSGLLNEDLYTLRKKLLSIKGIGPETADSIILYAANKPIFVVDAYTQRILLRHNLITEDADYHGIQELFMDSLPEDTDMFNEYHALLVRLGKEHCMKKNPICNGCPLEADPHTVQP